MSAAIRCWTCIAPEIDAASQSLSWIGYLSTTGVYGDHAGGWVDEMSELKPSGERGRRRAAAEAGWLALSQPAHLFRLAGIYGPGSSTLDTVREGRAKRIVKPGQIFSRIHVADIARVLEASMARPHPGAAYNVCDDDPAPPSDVIAFAAALLNLPPPPEVPFEQADLSPMARSFYEDNKRVSNSRIKRELGVALHTRAIASACLPSSRRAARSSLRACRRAARDPRRATGDGRRS